MTSLYNRIIEPWLQDWEKTYDDCRRLKLPNTDGSRPARDFIYAVDNIEPGFISYWRNRLHESKIELDFYEIIQKFREYRIESLERRFADNTAFLIF
jgi:hypothetical protein